MTTTSLTTFISGYDVDVRHGHFHLRASTPTTGAVYEGIGEFRVIRGGSVIHRKSNIHEFGWLGQDGDIVETRYTDTTGDHGDWVSYTFAVTGTHDLQYYVNGSTGSDANDGSSGTPFATIGKATTEVRAALTTGQVAAIHIAEAQTYNMAAASVWVGGTTARRCDFLRWGDSSTRPVITNCGGFSTGNRESFRIKGIDIEGEASAFAGIGCNRSGGTASDREPYNVIVQDCDLSGFDRGVEWDDPAIAAADRDVQRFVALDNVEVDGIRVFPFYGYAYPECWLFRDVTGLDFTSGGGSPFRGGIFANSYFENWSVTPSGSSGTNSCRIIQGDSSGAGALHNVSFSGCNFLLRGFYGVRLESDDRENFTNDITWADCNFDTSTDTQSWATTVHADGLTFERVAFRNCTFGSDMMFATNGAWSSGYDDVRFYNCAASRRNWAGEGLPVRTGTNAAAFADGTFEAYGTVSYRPRAGNEGTRSLFDVPTAAKVGTVLNCHIGKIDNPGGTQGIVNGSAASGTNTSTHSTTFNLTDGGTGFGTFDPHLTSVTVGDTELAGTGWPHSYSIDADGFMRDASTPDAGPYEFGASTLPDDPVIGGGGGGGGSPSTTPMAMGFGIGIGI